MPCKPVNGLQGICLIEASGKKRQAMKNDYTRLRNHGCGVNMAYCLLLDPNGRDLQKKRRILVNAAGFIVVPVPGMENEGNGDIIGRRGC